MKEFIILAMVIGFIVGLTAGLAFGSIVGDIGMRSKVARLEAVKHGAAVWVVSQNTGEVAFVWKDEIK